MAGTEEAPESLRLLPPDVQQVVLAFADQEAATARKKIADELLECRQEAASLADDNERLTAEKDDLLTQLAQATCDATAAEGRARQLTSELATAWDEIRAERVAAEQARTALATAELRLEPVRSLDEELRRVRKERDAQREARVEAERTVAVLGSQHKQHGERVQDLKTPLADLREACAWLETKNGQLAEMLEREQRVRGIAEREFEILAAMQAKGPGENTRDRRTGRA